MLPTVPGRVRLIVLNYNCGAFIGRCLAALHRLDWPTDQLELVVVDNDSTDGSAAVVEAEFPAVRLIRNPTNTGFPANNVALTDLAGIRYVGLVNPDSFVEPGWLRALAGALDADPLLGAASAKILFEPRFVDIVIDSPTFVPGIGDSRTLGVRVSGVRINGVDRWHQAKFGTGAWGIEQSAQGTFQWTDAHATLRVPLPDTDIVTDSDSGTSGDTGGPLVAQIDIEAERTKKIVIRSGDNERTVEVGVHAQSVEIHLDGEPYDLIQNAGSIVFDFGAGADRGFLERDAGQYDEPADIFAWCGGGVLFRPEYLDQVGLFDERFFLYYEDTDLSWRGRAQGWRYRYVPGAVMRHLHAASTGEGSALFAYHVERNRLLMLVKNAPIRLAAVQTLRFVLSTASYARRDIIGPLARRRRPSPITVRRRAGSFAGFLRLLPAMLVARRRLRRRQIVPDEELSSWLVRP
jgi:GT2 family glycosyltransferase